MRFIMLLTLLSISTLGFSQLTSNNIRETVPVKSESFVIGIGNAGSDMYNNVLDYLQNDNAISVYAVCESHHIIGIKVTNSAYKSYDLVRDLLMNEYPDILLNRKDDAIFTKDCSDEIKKQ